MRTVVLVLAGVLLAIFIVGGLLSLIPHDHCGVTLHHGSTTTTSHCTGK